MSSLPTVLVPGLICTPRLYAAQIPALWAFGPVTVADHRRDDGVDAIAARILADAPERFALTGLSMGGYIAMAILRAAPQRVAKLMLLDTGPRADTAAQSDNRRRQIAIAQGGRFGEIAGLLWPLFVHKNRHGDAALKEIVVTMAAETGPDAFVRQQTAIMTRPDARGALAAITCPTIILVGAEDELTPPALAHEMHALIPESRLTTIADCGHLSTLEQPEAVNRALVDFLRSP